MVYVIVKLKLESLERWKPVFDQKSTIRKENGSKEARLFVNSENHDEAMVLFEWDNIENARKYLESETLRETLKQVGATYTYTYLDEIEKTV